MSINMMLYVKMFPDRPVYLHNMRYYQIGKNGVVFDVSAVRIDPLMPDAGWLDITDAICNVTSEIEDVVKQIAREKGEWK